MKIASNLSILGFHLILHEGSGGLLHGMLPELPWSAELDGRLDVFASHGVSHAELSDIVGDLSVHLEKDRIHHGHGILANA